MKRFFESWVILHQVLEGPSKSSISARMAFVFTGQEKGMKTPGKPEPPSPYMCEIGTMWQIGVLTGKPCTFLLQKRQEQVSVEGILYLVNPNLGSNSGMRIFETRIFGGRILGSKFWSYVFLQ